MDKFNKYYKYIIPVILILSLFFNLKQCKDNDRIKDKTKQNNKAIGDVVRVSKNKSGDVEFNKLTYIAKINELKEMDSVLYSELKKEYGKVISLIKLGNKIVYDTIYLKSEVVKYPNGMNAITWKYDTLYSEGNSKELAGLTKFNIDSNGSVTNVISLLTKDINTFDITLGYKEVKDGIEVFARSKHPYFSSNQIKSVIIEKNDKLLSKYNKTNRLFLGPYVGLGVNNKLLITPTVGIGLGFNFLK